MHLLSNPPVWTTAQAQPTLEAGTVHVWRWNLEPERYDLTQLETLSPDERLRMNRFHFPADRQRFFIARATLRKLLAGYLAGSPASLCFIYSPHGKPSLADHPTLHFNLSHTKQTAVAAFTLAGPLGIDIEQPREIHPGLAERMFSPREKKAFQALPQERRTAAFFRCWTRKEAICKAEGLGLSLSTTSFTVSLDLTQPPAVESTAGVLTQTWSLHNLPEFCNTTGALATATPTTQIVFFSSPDSVR